MASLTIPVISKTPEMVTEEVARKAITRYFRWYAEENKVLPGDPPKLRSKPVRHDDKLGFTFVLFYGGRPVFVREVLPGRLEVWRQDMPKGTFKVVDL